MHGRLIEYLARLQRLHRTVVDFHLVAAFQDIADSVTARMPMRRAAISGIAFGETHGQPTTQDIVHHAVKNSVLRWPDDAAGAWAKDGMMPS